MSTEIVVPKQFKMTSLFFSHIPDAKPEYFDEHLPPWWLNHKENRWWFDKHVLTLDVGHSVKSDFQEIKRIA